MTITERALAEILSHAREEAPRECCGVLLGVGDRITDVVRARNTEAGETRFAIDPVDHIAARKRARAAHQDVIGFYHSHPESEPHPSPSDVAEWSYPDALSVIVGKERGRSFVRAFRITGATVEEVPLTVECP